MIESVDWSSCKVPFILVQFEWNVIFLGRFSKSTQIPYFMKIRSVGAELFHADRRKDIVAFRNFTSAPNKIMLYRETVIQSSKNRTKT